MGIKNKYIILPSREKSSKLYHAEDDSHIGWHLRFLHLFIAVIETSSSEEE